MKIKEALLQAREKIPINEARILLQKATNINLEYIISHDDEELSDKQNKDFIESCQRRAKGEPIAYITGVKEFYSRDFIVDQNVLIPRPDSEILIESVLQNNNLSNPKILELGIGSGCLILTLLLEIDNASGLGVDISDSAIEISNKNMQKFDLTDRCKIFKSNWFENISSKFDIIISNPPYIATGEQNHMSKETILFEPKEALYAKDNGLACYKEIASKAKDYLKDDGYIFVEIGFSQADKVEKIFKEYRFFLHSSHKDLSGIIRILVFATIAKHQN